MHLTGITYSFIQTIYSVGMMFLYNMGKYTIGKVGYQFLMLIPLSMLIKSITYIKFRLMKYIGKKRLNFILISIFIFY